MTLPRYQFYSRTGAMKGRLAMNPNFVTASVAQASSKAQAFQAKGNRHEPEKLPTRFAQHLAARSGRRERQAGKLHSSSTSYLAFFAIVLACLAAAATVTSQCLPVVMGGF